MLQRNSHREIMHHSIVFYNGAKVNYTYGMVGVDIKDLEGGRVQTTVWNNLENGVKTTTSYTIKPILVEAQMRQQQEVVLI